MAVKYKNLPDFAKAFYKIKLIFAEYGMFFTLSYSNQRKEVGDMKYQDGEEGGEAPEPEDGDPAPEDEDTPATE